MIIVTKLGKHLGARITGVDLSQPLDDATFAQVSKAFFDNEVVVFPQQKLTPEQQIAFTRRFGVLEHHVRKEARLADHPEIFILSNILDDNGKAIGAQDAGPLLAQRPVVQARAQPAVGAVCSQDSGQGRQTAGRHAFRQQYGRL